MHKSYNLINEQNFAIRKMNVSWYYPVYQASKGDKDREKKRERGLGKEGRDMPLTLFPPPLPSPHFICAFQADYLISKDMVSQVI